MPVYVMYVQSGMTLIAWVKQLKIPVWGMRSRGTALSTQVSVTSSFPFPMLHEENSGRLLFPVTQHSSLYKLG